MVNKKTKSVLLLILKEFKKPEEHFNSPTNGYTIRREDFPAPLLLDYLMTKVFDFPSRRMLEKTLWEIYLYYKDVEIILSLSKFGLRIYISDKVAIEEERQLVYKAVLSKMKKAISILERKYLTSVAKKQIDSWAITVDNQFVKFTSMYYYFREQAVAAFKGKGKNWRGTRSVFGISPNMFQMNLVGFYNTSSMIDVYFSRLEHLFVISLPFIPRIRRKSINLIEFTSKHWGDKYKILFDMTSDKTAKAFFDSLKEVKEKFRNTYSHGGFEKDGASFFFHLNHIGAIPASLTSFDKSPHFNFFPIEIDSFEKVCKLFDDFDKWLKNSFIKYGYRFAETGIEISFDYNSIRENKKGMKNDLEFEKLIESRGNFSDMYANMDF